MKPELFEHRPTVVTVEAVTESHPGLGGQLYRIDGNCVQVGDIAVTTEDGILTYTTVKDFEANYKPKSQIKELGHMKLPNYPGSTVKIFESWNFLDLETQIQQFFHEGLNALVLDKQYWGVPCDYFEAGERKTMPKLYAAFTLNTVVPEDELKERTEIQKIADEEYQKRLAEKAKVNEKAIDIAKKLSAERQAEEDRKRKQLLEDAELGKKCRNNHGRLAKGKSK